MNTFIKKLVALIVFSLPLLPIQHAVFAQNGSLIDESIYKNLPFDMPEGKTTFIPRLYSQYFRIRRQK